MRPTYGCRSPTGLSLIHISEPTRPERISYAVFVSCTSLRTFGIVADLEAELGGPVVSSNQALAWHLHRLAGVQDALPGFGTLFEHGLPA